MSSTFDGIMTPALFTTMSIAPKRRAALSKHAATAGPLVTSVGIAMALAPSLRTLVATSASALAPRATRTTFAPAAANASAVSRPMPLEAPVTSTVRSARDMRCGGSAVAGHLLRRRRLSLPVT